MRLELENILKIKKANIELGGLTIIAGENNSGKSSIGKILFSILKSVNITGSVNREETIINIRAELLYIKNKLFQEVPAPQIMADLDKLSLLLLDKILPVKQFADDLHDFIPLSIQLSNRNLQILFGHFRAIEKHIEAYYNPKSVYIKNFDGLIKNEFMEPINSFKSTYSKILYVDDTDKIDGNIISLVFSEWKLKNTELKGLPSIEDITLIESPVFLPILDSIRWLQSISSVRSNRFRFSNHAYIPFHISDMAEKISGLPEVKNNAFINDTDIDISSHIQKTLESTIGGKFSVSHKTRQLTFNQNGRYIPTVSLASGIKAFGVLQRLIDTGNLSTSKMLIWDEPEIHLHPEWQVVFCELIADLVSLGVPIVLSSHSPYFIQAIRYFAAAKGIENDTKYYMSEICKDTGLCIFEDVTHDLNRIFSKLAAPLRGIMNVDEVRSHK